MRQELVTYASLPFYRAMLEGSGFGGDLAAFDEGMQAGDVEKAKSGLSDGLLASLAGIGSGDVVRATVERYRDAGATSPSIGGLPGSDFEGAMRAVAELINSKRVVRVSQIARMEPPSTGIIAPVMYEAAGESRNAATRPNSSGSPYLRNGMSSDLRARTSSGSPLRASS